MAIIREQQPFPTRNYPYRAAPPPAIVGLAAPQAGPAPNTLHRMVVGLDAFPRPLAPEELGELGDPFGRLLQAGHPFPLTLRQVLQALDGLHGTAEALPQQLVFLAADGGHVPWTPATNELQRAFRFVVARGAGEFPVLISASTLADSAADAAFLQVLGWDAGHEVFHYYERRAGTYFWAGSSPHALADATRGKGPFDSHVNGSLVMKELRAPWLNWHSPQAGINAEALAPTDPLRHDPLFTSRVTAERLEQEVVRPGIHRWNAARVRQALGPDGSWQQVPHFLRQVITETTVNLASADTASEVLADTSQLRPPLSFFLNRDTLFNTLDLVPPDPVVADIVLPAHLYRACLLRYDVHRSDGLLRLEGDTHFPFLTPEPAFEDTDLLAQLVQAELLTPQFAACLTMTDFYNPIFSTRRAALLRYVPAAAAGPRPAETLAKHFVAALEAASRNNRQGAGRPDSPEQEFLANWHTANWPAAFSQRISDYCQALRAGADSPTVVDGWFQLLEYRRRCFRRRPLAEFALTTPRTTIAANAPPWRMTAQGRAEPVVGQAKR